MKNNIKITRAGNKAKIVVNGICVKSFVHVRDVKKIVAEINAGDWDSYIAKNSK